MKISKLFHWLYAILMLLPILVFIPNAFYYGFNEQAVAQEKTEQVPVYYQTNDINTPLDFVNGNVYTWLDNFNGIGSTTQNMFFNITILSGSYKGTTTNMYLQSSGNVAIIYNYTNVNAVRFDFVINEIRTTIQDMPNEVLERFTRCNSQYVSEYVEVTTNMSITDSMSYAWESIWQNDLFSWSYGSFLTQPFIYIGNLFNVPVDNSLYYALSYWLDISLIWLTFDLLMYVPLLVHRWLDKGIIE